MSGEINHSFDSLKQIDAGVLNVGYAEAVMRTEAQRAKADRLRELHRGVGVLVLPNAWDALSAKVFEECGFPAVATTSAGIAYALGYPDGERLTRDEMAEATSRIA